MFCFLVKRLDSNFVGLKVPSHCVAYWCAFERSELSLFDVSSGLSANSLIDALICSTILHLVELPFAFCHVNGL